MRNRITLPTSPAYQYCVDVTARHDHATTLFSLNQFSH